MPNERQHVFTDPLATRKIRFSTKYKKSELIPVKAADIKLGNVRTRNDQVKRQTQYHSLLLPSLSR